MATVTWWASAGANHYTVLAEADGQSDSCKSTGTSCELTGLQCGENYNVTVLAGDGKCNSSMLAKTSVTTGKEMHRRREASIYVECIVADSFEYIE